MSDASNPSDAVVGELQFIGTATVLLRLGDFTILTDPNFLHQGEHAPLGYGLRSRRLTEPAMALADLPPLDFVVLSHHHGDHFDPTVVRELDKEVRIVTTPHAARKLHRQGFRNAEPLDTWASRSFTKGRTKITVTALPAKHAPQPLQSIFPSVMGSMLEVEHNGSPWLKLYISGDTLVHDRLREIPQRYPEIHMALLHLGGTRVMGVLVTMDADQGVQALEILKPQHAIPIHYDDYTVFKSPLEDFRAAVSNRSDLGTVVHYLDRGDSYRFSAEPGTQ
ncbi:MAG: hypothetical protein JWL70_1040 [Acidimicrobiia bacterium]|nr:hypothetical protein [Acidimicrobiia bacterium]